MCFWLVDEVAWVVLTKLKAFPRVAHGICGDECAIAREQCAMRAFAKFTHDDGGVRVVLAREII